MICPCKNCPDKGCGTKHDSCELYKLWIKKHNIAKHLNRQEKEL